MDWSMVAVWINESVIDVLGGNSTAGQQQPLRVDIDGASGIHMMHRHDATKSRQHTPAK
jgi:hypothetical protein